MVRFLAVAFFLSFFFPFITFFLFIHNDELFNNEEHWPPGISNVISGSLITSYFLLVIIIIVIVVVITNLLFLFCFMLCLFIYLFFFNRIDTF